MYSRSTATSSWNTLCIHESSTASASTWSKNVLVVFINFLYHKVTEFEILFQYCTLPTMAVIKRVPLSFPYRSFCDGWTCWIYNRITTGIILWGELILTRYTWGPGCIKNAELQTQNQFCDSISKFKWNEKFFS
jgi:hypothetical protein